MVLRKGRAEQLAALALVRRAGHGHVGDAAHKRNVVGPGVRGAVSAHQARTVERKHHGQVLQRHVVDHLVVAALQKGGVNGHHGFGAFAGHAGRKGDGVLLGNADVVVAVGKALVELDHAYPSPRAWRA